MFYIYAQMYAYKALENCTRVQWGAVGCSRACGVGAVKFAWDHKRGGPLSVGCGAAKVQLYQVRPVLTVRRKRERK
jgi:hypothetical protein